MVSGGQSRQRERVLDQGRYVFPPALLVVVEPASTWQLGKMSRMAGWFPWLQVTTPLSPPPSHFF